MVTDNFEIIADCCEDCINHKVTVGKYYSAITVCKIDGKLRVIDDTTKGCNEFKSDVEFIFAERRTDNE